MEAMRDENRRDPEAGDVSDEEQDVSTEEEGRNQKRMLQSNY
jgi:hypothetical protein